MARSFWLLGLLLLLNGDLPGQTQRLSLQAPAVAFCGDTLEASVYGTFPGGLLGLQFSVQWDTSQLGFVASNAFDLQGSTPVTSTASVDTGLMTYVWVDPGSSTGALLDSTQLLTLTFVVKTSGVGATLSLVNFPTLIEAVDVNFNSLYAPPDIAVPPFTVLLADPLGICGAPLWSVGALLRTEAGDGVEGAKTDLSFSFSGTYANSTQSISNAAGQVALNNTLPYAADFTLTPYLNSDPTNGLTTYDLYLINRYILGLLPLSPYRQIAADANHSNTVTSTDIVVLRRLILGLESGFPNNTSWRFIPEAYVFPNPVNAFVTPFPETASATLAATTPPEQRFVGVKIGDVNGSAIPNNWLALDERNAPVVRLVANDRWLDAGEEFEAVLTADAPCLALQGTLELDGAVVLSAQAGSDSNADYAALHEAGEAVSFAWEAQSEKAENVQLALHCRAERAGWLSQFLHVKSRITPTSVTLADGSSGQLDLQFATQLTPEKELFALQLAPNPWSTQTQLGFWSPRETAVDLGVYDAVGRVLFSQTINATRGYNTVVLHREQLPVASGLLFCRISSEAGSVTHPMWAR